MAAISSQGSKVSVATQVDFPTPNTASMKDVRLEGEPTPATAVENGLAPETRGANPYENEKPITIPVAQDDGLVLTTLIRQSATPGTDSIIVKAFKAAGLDVYSSTSTTVGAGATASVIPVASVAGLEAGMGVNIELDDGTFIPTLIGDISGTDIIPVMALPSAPSNGNVVGKAFTIVPGKQDAVPSDQFLTLLHADKSDQTRYDTCALTSVGDLTFERDAKMMLEFTFGTVNKEKIDTPMTGTNDYNDALGALRVHNPYCQYSDTPTTYTAAAAASYQKLLNGTVSFNIATEQVTGYGDPDCVNNVQDWMQVGAPPEVTIELLYDSTRIDDFDGDNDSKYISMIQPGTAEADPAVGFFMVNSHQSAEPEKVPYGNAQHQITTKYTSNPSTIDGTTTSDAGFQPWALVIADRSA